MSRWLRWYRGTTENPKFKLAARNGKVTLVTVLAVWQTVLEDAASPDHRGVCEKREDFIAAALDIDDDGTVEGALRGLEYVGLISVGAGAITVIGWAKWQYDQDVADPTNADRQRRFKEKKRSGNAKVTVEKRPDTDTDTEDTASAVSGAGPRIPYDEIETKCRKAAGLESDPSPSLCDLSPIVGLIDQGVDLDRQIVPVIKAKARKGVRSWRFFLPAITEALAEQTPIIAKPIQKTQAEQEESWRSMLRLHRAGNWSDYWGPPPGKAGCVIPADFVATLPSQFPEQKDSVAA